IRPRTILYRTVNISAWTTRVKRVNVTIGTKKEESCRAEGTTARIRRRGGPGPRASGLLAQGLRGGLAAGADKGDGYQPPQSVCGLREQGSVVSQGRRSLRRGTGVLRACS